MKPAKTEKRERGRPQKFKTDEKWGRTTVILRDWEIAFLDRLAIDIREATGIALNRSDLIRETIGILVNAHKEGTLKFKELKDKSISSQLGVLISMSAKK